jgi:steroid delta-isomerase-like uncharacterized protein
MPGAHRISHRERMTNQQIVKRYYDEVWCNGKTAIIDEVMAPDYENHDPATPGKCIKGREAFKGLIAAYREAFPDLRMDIYEQHTSGDTVISRWRAIGTHKGALMGIPPTGKRGEPVEGVTFSRFANGKIVRDEAVWDLAGLLRNLGVLPS